MEKHVKRNAFQKINHTKIGLDSISSIKDVFQNNTILDSINKMLGYISCFISEKHVHLIKIWFCFPLKTKTLSNVLQTHWNRPHFRLN